MIKYFKTIKLLGMMFVLTAFLGGEVYLVDLGYFHLLPVRMVVIVIALLIGMMAFKYNKIVCEGVNIKWLLLFNILWFAFAMISLVWVEDASFWFKQITLFGTGIFLVLVVINVCNNNKDIEKIFYIIFIMVFLAIMVAIIESFIGVRLFNRRFALEQVQGFGMFGFIPRSFWTNQNDFATMLCLFSPFIIAWLKYCPKKQYKNILSVLLAVLLLLIFIMIVLTNSRANLLGFIGVIILFILIKSDLRFKIRFMLAIIVMALCISPFISNLWSNALLQINSITIVQNQWGSNEVRINLVEQGLRKLQDTYYMGVGCGNSTAYFFQSPYYAITGIASPHNYWLELLLDYGALFFTAYMAYYIAIIINLLIIMKNADNYYIKMASEAIFVSLIVFSIANQSSSSLTNELFVFLVFGLSLSVINMFRKERMKCE